MKKMHVLGFAGVAAAVICLPLAHATDQSTGAPRTPPGIPNLSALDFANQPAAGFKSQAPRASAFVRGWNFRVCFQSRSTIQGADHVIFVFNTDGSGFFFGSPTENATQHQLWAACQHGAAGYWIFVTNTITLTYSDVAINYP